MKRLLSVLLTMSLLLSLAPAVLAAEGDAGDEYDIGYTDGYNDGYTDGYGDAWNDFYGGEDGGAWYEPGVTFTDVPAGAWYEEALSACYDLDLVSGTTDTAFSPDGQVTLAEAITFAARARDSYDYDFGQGFEETDPWYQTYVDYAQEKGIIAQGQFTDMGAAATRRDVAVIMASALPDTEDLGPGYTLENYERISGAADGVISDVPMTDPGAAAVYKLYRAGILTGGEDGSFRPGDPITRAEVVAILDRLVNEYSRVPFFMTKDGTFDIYVGGLGFNVPEGAEVTGWDGDYTVYIPGEDGQSVSIISLAAIPTYLEREQYEACRDLILDLAVSALEKALAGEDAAAEVKSSFTDSAVGGLPSTHVEISVPVPEESALPIEGEILYNPTNRNVVLAFSTYDTETENGGAAAAETFKAILNTLTADPDNVGEPVNPELAVFMDKLAKFLPAYLEFLPRFQETLKAELPDLYAELEDYGKQIVGLITGAAGLDTSSLTEADGIYIVGRIVGILGGIPGAKDALLEMIDSLFTAYELEQPAEDLAGLMEGLEASLQGRLPHIGGALREDR